MKQMMINMGISLMMGMVLPHMLLSWGIATQEEYTNGELPTIPIKIEESAPETVSLPVCLTDDAGTVRNLDMDTYLTGVLLAEMPSSFSLEALKAQSVVARTYARKAYITGGKHQNGSVCTDPGCCQGYLLEEIYLAEGGNTAAVERICAAISETSGQVLTYDQELIEATYFSCSGGRTEAAVAVWGTDFPYLKSVESPGEEQALHYTDTAVFTPEEFASLLQISPEGEPAGWIGDAVYTEGGSVRSMLIGGKNFTGIQLRNILGLRSAAFSIAAQKDEIVITTKGYGHRVGMSQYGAEAMASQGASYEEILKHYYQGAEITRLREEIYG